MTKSVLILEDMPDTQNWLQGACLLAFPDATIIIASNLAAAGEHLKTFRPDIALVDLELPDGKGHHFIAALQGQYPDCLSIVVTIYADESHLLPSLKAGAKGYILKDQSRQRIADMLKQAVVGELPLSPAVARLVLDQMANVTIEEPLENSLTNREIDVLKLVAAGASTPGVAEKLGISKYTVEDHLKQIYRKLNISSRAEAALAARRLKLV
jgi:DNA-binding NarL/FixJ family response regulator